jgi:hypothetical protein
MHCYYSPLRDGSILALVSDQNRLTARLEARTDENFRRDYDGNHHRGSSTFKGHTAGLQRRTKRLSRGTGRSVWEMRQGATTSQ